jgi:hypothetical protein
MVCYVVEQLYPLICGHCSTDLRFIYSYTLLNMTQFQKFIVFFPFRDLPPPLFTLLRRHIQRSMVSYIIPICTAANKEVIHCDHIIVERVLLTCHNHNPTTLNLLFVMGLETEHVVSEEALYRCL